MYGRVKKVPENSHDMRVMGRMEETLDGKVRNI